MAFPPWPYMLEKLATLDVAGLAPESADMSPYRVQRRLPVDAGPQGFGALATDLAQQVAWAANTQVGGQEVDPGRWLAAHMGQQPVAGNDPDRSAMPGLFQRHHGIDHGQAGADDQHRALWIEPRQGRYVPRVQRRRVQAVRLLLPGPRRREHTGRQYRMLPSQLPAIGQGQVYAVAVAVQVDRLAAHMLGCRAPGRPLLPGLGQALLDVEAEDSSGHEQFADRHLLLVRLGPAASGDMDLQPFGQVIGIVRVDAHPRRIGVQRVPKLRGTVGLTPSQLGTWLDDQNPPPARQTQQLHCQHRATQTTTDNQYIGRQDSVCCLSAQGFSHYSLSCSMLASVESVQVAVTSQSSDVLPSTSRPVSNTGQAVGKDRLQSPRECKKQAWDIARTKKA